MAPEHLAGLMVSLWPVVGLRVTFPLLSAMDGDWPGSSLVLVSAP